MENNEKNLMKKFIFWLNSNINNGFISKTEVSFLPNYGGSLISKEKIKKEEIIIEIPQTLFLSLDNAYKNEIIKNVIVKKNIFLAKKTIFVFFLWIQVCLKEKSFWNSYFEILPSNYFNVISWTEEQIKLLKRKDLIDFFLKKKQSVENEFMKLKEILLRENELNEIYKNIQMENFLKLYSLIESRTLYYENNSDSDSSIGALVPYYDVCNHEFLNDVNHFNYFYFDKEKKTYVLKAYKDFEPNEQIFISYGNYNNLHFLELYGFIPTKNCLNNFFSIKVALNLSKICGKKVKILQENFDKKMEIIKKFLPHFCKNNNKKKTEIDNNITIQIENSEGLTKFSWEIEVFFYILTLNANEISLKKCDYIAFLDFQQEAKRNICFKEILVELKKYLLKECFLEDELSKEIKFGNDYIIHLTKAYHGYELNLLNALNY